MEFVLIGFEYFGNKKLPGILVDLYLSYNFIKRFHNSSSIIIISDIQKDSNTKLVRSAILEQIVDSNILSFVKDCKELGIYKQFKSSGYYNNLDSHLSKLNGDKLFIYYTGHSKDGNLILPNHSLYSLETFKFQLSKFKSVLCILDCCESTGLKLPFRLIDNVYRLENTHFNQNRIICISSSLSEQDSIVMRSGSIFTRHIFKLMTEKDIHLSDLLENINLSLYKFCKKYNTKQTVNIYATHPNLVYIFGWIYNHVDVEINIDKIYNCLELNL